MNFVIWAPPYRNESSGVRVLHRLCHLLNCIGTNASITTEITHPDWNTPLARSISSDTVVVYPEVVIGNPLNARRVVRYVLNDPGLLGGERTYDDREMVFFYDDLFRATAQSATSEALGEERKLRISVLEPELFYDDRSRARTYDCFYVGKGRSIREEHRLPNEAGMVHIQALFPPTRIGLADLLRGCRTLFTYDTVSAISHEGRVCGTNVVFVTADGLIDYTADFAGYEADYYDTAKIERFVALNELHWTGDDDQAELSAANETSTERAFGNLFTAQVTLAERYRKRNTALELEIEELKERLGGANSEPAKLRIRELEQQLSGAWSEITRLRHLIAEERSRSGSLAETLAAQNARAEALHHAVMRAHAEVERLQNLRVLDDTARRRDSSALRHLEVENERLKTIATNYVRLSHQFSRTSLGLPTAN